MNWIRRVWAKVPTLYRDLTERAAKTYVQTFLGVVFAAHANVAALASLQLYKQAALAGLPAVLSVATSIVSSWKGNPDSASLVNDVRAPRPFGNGAPVAPAPAADPPTLGDPANAAPTVDLAAVPPNAVEVAGPTQRILNDPTITGPDHG